MGREGEECIVSWVLYEYRDVKKRKEWYLEIYNPPQLKDYDS